MVSIKRVYEPPSPADGRRILVDRLWPRGIKKENAKIDEWLKEIAPSTALRQWYSHDPAKWPEFRRRYKRELEVRQDIIDRLVQEAKKGRITLLFAAKGAIEVNAAVLKEVIEKSIP
jgi:uncharacterized protein YeaO (DUF488 family)